MIFTQNLNFYSSIVVQNLSLLAFPYKNFQNIKLNNNPLPSNLFDISYTITGSNSYRITL